MCGYLRSLTPAEELALFLDSRGHCLYYTGNTREALICYAQAYKIAPNLDILAHIARVQSDEFGIYRQIKNDIDNRKPEKSK
jgi:hypothetical protein